MNYQSHQLKYCESKVYYVLFGKPLKVGECISHVFDQDKMSKNILTWTATLRRPLPSNNVTFLSETNHVNFGATNYQ